ncbi:MAG: DUF364 domain-containing protein [Candidatus Limivicinus sp.]|nr:DUF364 domain-containing protein [Candidatus Limivicinus sp.]
MKSDFFELYEVLAAGVDSGETISGAVAGKYWTSVRTCSSTGFAMTTPGDSIAPMFPDGVAGLSLREAGRAAASWNLTEAGFGLAAINAYYNTAERMERLQSYEPFDNYSTQGIDLRGRTVGIVGHMRGPKGLREQAKAVYVTERCPQPGDYPDAACDWILPRCDLVLITGSSLVNKTLPHLLELCRDACTILTGPSVPMCPALLDFGIDRLAGLVITEHESADVHVRTGAAGHPYGLGRSFLLKK